jgi:preprotein translocase subunit SecE
VAEAVEKKKSGNKIVKFFKEVKSEMKKVVWPSRKQVTNNTLIVLAVVVLVGLVIWVLDLLFQYGLFQFIK